MRLVERSQSLVNGVSSIRVKQGLFFDFFLSLDLGMEGLARSRASIWPRKWGHAKMGSGCKKMGSEKMGSGCKS